MSSSTLSRTAAYEALQQKQLSGFLLFFGRVVAVFAAFYGAGAIVLERPSYWLQFAIVLGFVVLARYARRWASAGATERAALTIGYSILLAVVAVAYTSRQEYVTLMVSSMLAVALVLPYLEGQRLRLFMGASLATLGWAMFRGLYPVPSIHADPFARLLTMLSTMGAGLLFFATLSMYIHRQRHAVRETLEASALAEEVAERAHFLSELSSVMGSSLDGATIAQRLSQVLVPKLADLCVIHEIHGGHNGDPQVRQVEISHLDPQRERAYRLTAEPMPLSRTEHPAVRAIVTQTPVVMFAAEPRADALLGPLAEASSYAAIPLVARGKVLGCLTVGMSESRRAYEPVDLELLQEVALRVALALDNSRLYLEARDAVAARDEFLSVASHELKTPLTSLDLQVATMMRLQGRGEELTPERVAQKLAVIKRQVDRLDLLIDNLLDVSRLMSGRFPLHLERTDLSEVVQSVVARFREELARADCQLSLSLDPSCVGDWDPMRLDQVISNLLSNAIKYSPGRPVEVRVERIGGAARLQVSDRGKGISAENQARIFEKFERATSARDVGGLGLGLWIVKQIVEAMNGAVSLRSEMGAGSEFTVMLPLHSNDQTSTAMH
jgi:signal transduction histidine kinase